MDNSKIGWVATATGLLLLVVLTPLLVLSIAAQEQADQEALFAACMPGSDGQVQIPTQYLDPIEKAAQTAQLPTAVIAAQLHVESGFDPNAVSPSGARGIAQFMPFVWDEWGNGADPFDPVAGIDAQGRLMVELQRLVGPLISTDQERIELALAAYNAGAGAVLRAGGIPSIPETQNYVQKITTLAQLDYSVGCEIPGGDVIGEVGSGKWAHPLPGSVVTSLFGARDCIPGLKCDASLRQHDGLDMSTGGGALVVAATDLRITMVTNEDSQGALVMGEDPNDASVQFLYVHCVKGSHRVREGQTVAAGTPLCTEGQTGRANGPHLHLEIRKNGTPVDPEPILLSHGIALRYNPGLN